MRVGVPAATDRHDNKMAQHDRYERTMMRPLMGEMLNGKRLAIWARHTLWCLATLAGSMFVMACARAADPIVTDVVINAPIDKVWSLLSSGEGYVLMGAAQADMDLRIGGRLRSHDDPRGVLGDARGMQWEIVAYEPQRLLASRPVQVPADLPQGALLLQTWTLVYFNSIAGATTHVRVAMLGYGDDPESQAARAATATRTRTHLERLVKHFRAQCARCERPQ